MVDKYAEPKQLLNDMAAVKMAMNSHKGAIEDNNPRIIIALLKDEVDELDEAIGKNSELMHIIEEAADVQNFLVALVHRTVEEYRNRK